MQRVQGRMTAVLAMAVAAALMLAAVAAACPKGGSGINGGGPKGKTTICHHTSSETNPWVTIRVSNSSLKAHVKHGDIIPAPAEGCPAGDDGGGGGGGGTDPT